MPSAALLREQPARAARARWDEAAVAAAGAAAADPHLGRCLYVSRLLGRDPALVLHGGGNTSVKSEVSEVSGDPQPVLWIKGTGRDLAAVEAGSFSPLALAPLRRLLSLERLDDLAMARELRRALVDPDAPRPSVETLTHAALPHRYVLHAHPDGVLAATSVPAATLVARRLFGAAFPVIPWALPGFALARAVMDVWQRERRRDLRGIILLHHGILTFADDARTAWEAMLECVARAEAALPARRPTPVRAGVRWRPADVAGLRHELSRLAGRPMIVTFDDSPPARQFADLPEAAELAQRGPLSACHVACTKRTAALVPHPGAVRSALARFAHDYRGYFRRFAAGRPLTMRDAAPRVVIAPGAGVFTCGESPAEAAAVCDLWRHTMPAMLAAERLGGYRSLPARQVFELEYRPREQERLNRGAAPLPLAGRVALVAGAAQGVGRAVVHELLAQGAAVVGLDGEPTATREGYLGIAGDPRCPGTCESALEAAARCFGGLDLLVAIEGELPPGPPPAPLPLAQWRVHGEASSFPQVALLRAAIPLLERAPGRASVVFVGARDGDVSGPAAADLAVRGIRVNALYPDGLSWGAGPQRSAVARLAVALCTELFACTTGAQIPVGGSRWQSV
jgi:rhamnose utilization protein RhaD (predicted bifunctional aldolase and dehydrogenase)/NAD(P)-dependent dehydrogenase (short-subunit alcohol dehydrogenase family)